MRCSRSFVSIGPVTAGYHALTSVAANGCQVGRCNGRGVSGGQVYRPRGLRWAGGVSAGQVYRPWYVSEQVILV